MIPFRVKTDPHALAVGMAGTKMGDRVVQIGCADGARLAAIASTVGLSGRAIAVVPDAESAARVESGARARGVLVEVEIAPLSKLPLEDNAYDLAIVDDTGALFTSLDADEQRALVAEALRLLRSGGRLMIVGNTPREGLTSMLSRNKAPVSADPLPALQACGVKAARLLGEREGLRFVEGVKPRAQ